MQRILVGIKYAEDIDGVLASSMLKVMMLGNRFMGLQR